jgi:hypothetical protein
VIVRISGWGQTGPYVHKPGFGTLVEAMSGFAHLNGFPDRPPALPPLALADMIAGMQGAFATMTALRAAEREGRGQEIDLSLPRRTPTEHISTDARGLPVRHSIRFVPASPRRRGARRAPCRGPADRLRRLVGGRPRRRRESCTDHVERVSARTPRRDRGEVDARRLRRGGAKTGRADA